MAEQWEYAILTVAGDSKEVNAYLNGQLLHRMDITDVTREEQGRNPKSLLFDILNNLGSQGWELVTAQGNRYIFKRRTS